MGKIKHEKMKYYFITFLVNCGNKSYYKNEAISIHPAEYIHFKNHQGENEKKEYIIIFYEKISEGNFNSYYASERYYIDQSKK